MGLGLGARSKAKVDIVPVKIGAGKVGATPDGMGRVGLAGGRENSVRVGRIEVEPDVSIIDSAVPPVPTEGSAISDPSRVDRDEL
jgi:hypothetical protein